MKKILTAALVLYIAISLFGCSKPYEIKDLSDTASIIIRVHTGIEQTYTDYRISEKDHVQEICGMFSSLAANQIQNDKETGCSYSICFLNDQGVIIETIDFISNIHNAILVYSNNELYKITSSVEVAERIKDILTANGYVTE